MDSTNDIRGEEQDHTLQKLRWENKDLSRKLKVLRNIIIIKEQLIIKL